MTNQKIKKRKAKEIITYESTEKNKRTCGLGKRKGPNDTRK